MEYKYYTTRQLEALLGKERKVSFTSVLESNEYHIHLIEEAKEKGLIENNAL